MTVVLRLYHRPHAAPIEVFASGVEGHMSRGIKGAYAQLRYFEVVSVHLGSERLNGVPM